MNDKDFGGRVGVVGSGRSIYVLSLFLLNIGLARSMGSELFGSFLQVFMFSALFTVLCLGVPQTMYFFLPRLTAEERPGFLGQTILLLAFNGIVIALGLVVFAPYLAGMQDNPGIAGNLRIFGLYGAFLIGSSFADPLFITFKRIKYLFILSVLHGFFFIGLTIWQYVTGAGPRSLFIAMAVFGFMKLALAVTFMYRMRPVIGDIRYFGGKRMLLLQLSFSLPVALSNTVDIISAWLDKFVISIFFGPAGLGIFYIGAIEIPFVSVLLSSVYSVVSPVINKLHHEGDIAGFAGFVKKTIKFTAKMIWPLFIYLMVFADHIIPVVFGEGYEGSVLPFRIYLLMMPLRIALYGVIVIALGHSRMVFWAALTALGVNFSLNLLLVRLIGFPGPAVATVISTYIHVTVLVVFIMRTAKLRLGDLFPLRALFDIGIISLISGMISYLLTRGFPNIHISEVWLIILSLSIFVGSYIFLGSKAGPLTLPSLMDILEGNISGKKNKRT